jgi:hypothetical protein
MSNAWLQPTLERISDLMKLPHLDNEYGTPKVDPQSTRIAIQFLLNHMLPDAPAPRIVPNSRGGLHFEWNGPMTQCQADFGPDCVVSATYEKEQAGNLEEAGVFLDHALMVFKQEQAQAAA